MRTRRSLFERRSALRPPLSTAGLEQGSAAVHGCSVESDGRGPAIRCALPFRSPERSRGTTGRPAPCPFDAGAAHLAAAAPKRARRPGALRGGCLMLAKRLPLRTSRRCQEVRKGGARQPASTAVGFRRVSPPPRPVRPHPPHRPVIARPREIFAGRARCPRRLRSGTSAVTAARPELSLEPVGTAGTAQHPAAIRKAFCDAALGPPARPEPG